MFDEVAGTVATAVISAAGSDVWAAMREGLARLLGRGDGRREQAELERLDRTASELSAAGLDEEGRIRLHQSWQTRLETVLEGLDEDERDRVVARLRALVEQYAPRAAQDGGGISGNVFHGPTSIQSGSGNQQTNNFGGFGPGA